AGTLVAAVERPPSAPAAAADDRIHRLHCEISAVLDQLRVHAVDRPQRPVDLLGRVVACLQSADAGIDQRPQPRHLARASLREREVHLHMLAPTPRRAVPNLGLTVAPFAARSRIWRGLPQFWTYRRKQSRRSASARRNINSWRASSPPSRRSQSCSGSAS